MVNEIVTGNVTVEDAKRFFAETAIKFHQSYLHLISKNCYFQADLHQVQVFDTDRGNEFKNILIDEALETFKIKRSLSMKGCPYENAVAEATFKIIKTEFVKKRSFDSLEDLTRELHEYVHWFNHLRIDGTLDYLSPIEYKLVHLK